MHNDFGIVYNLWDYAGEPGELLDRAIGEVGLDHLTVPVITGPCTHYRVAPAEPPHLFATEGGWHYPTQSGGYAGTSIRPRGARWFGKRNVLGHVAEYSAKRGVPVIFRIALRSVASVVESEPHLRQRNAWGDEVTSSGACVMNPDFRELLHSTIEDLRRYEPAGFELVDWTPDLAVDRAQPRALDWHPTIRLLLDVCFCPACRQAAAADGAEPDDAARSVQVHVRRLLTGASDAHLTRLVEDEVLKQYIRSRWDDSRAALERLAESFDQRRGYLLMAYNVGSVHPAAEYDRQALAATQPAAPSDDFVRVFRPMPMPALRDWRRQHVRALLGADSDAFGLAMPVWGPHVRQADELVRGVSEAVNGGFHFFDFEGLAEAPAEVVDWLRQAVRFARRE